MYVCKSTDDCQFKCRIYQIIVQARSLEMGRKKGNVLFNDALNTFYLRLYGVRHNYGKEPLRYQDR